MSEYLDHLLTLAKSKDLTKLNAEGLQYAHELLDLLDSKQQSAGATVAAAAAAAESKNASSTSVAPVAVSAAHRAETYPSTPPVPASPVSASTSTSSSASTSSTSASAPGAEQAIADLENRTLGLLNRVTQGATVEESASGPIGTETPKTHRGALRNAGLAESGSSSVEPAIQVYNNGGAPVDVLYTLLMHLSQRDQRQRQQLARLSSRVEAFERTQGSMVEAFSRLGDIVMGTREMLTSIMTSVGVPGGSISQATSTSTSFSSLDTATGPVASNGDTTGAGPACGRRRPYSWLRFVLYQGGKTLLLVLLYILLKYLRYRFRGRLPAFVTEQ